jgi:hypothetical protein
MLVSNSKDNTSFTSAINLNIQHELYNDTSSDWLQFIQDHREYLRERSEYTEVTPNEMAYYQYRIRKYLEHKSYGTMYELIFRIVNYLTRDSDFNSSITGVYFPNTDDIIELRRLYQTVQAQLSKM